jgi:hypothetical protein
MHIQILALLAEQFERQIVIQDYSAAGKGRQAVTKTSQKRSLRCEAANGVAAFMP